MNSGFFFRTRFGHTRKNFFGVTFVFVFRTHYAKCTSQKNSDQRNQNQIKTERIFVQINNANGQAWGQKSEIYQKWYSYRFYAFVGFQLLFFPFFRRGHSGRLWWFSLLLRSEFCTTNFSTSKKGTGIKVFQHFVFQKMNEINNWFFSLGLTLNCTSTEKRLMISRSWIAFHDYQQFLNCFSWLSADPELPNGIRTETD